MIDKALSAETGRIRIDMTYYGFVVDSENPIGGGGGCSGGSCSTDGGCSSGSCSC